MFWEGSCLPPRIKRGGVWRGRLVVTAARWVLLWPTSLSPWASEKSELKKNRQKINRKGIKREGAFLSIFCRLLTPEWLSCGLLLDSLGLQRGQEPNKKSTENRQKRVIFGICVSANFLLISGCVLGRFYAILGSSWKRLGSRSFTKTPQDALTTPPKRS